MNIWKLGTIWGKGAPSFYEYIKENEIIIAHESAIRPQKGDYMLITDGFTVLAVAVLEEDTKPISAGSELGNSLENTFWVEITEGLVFAPAKYKVLAKKEQFKYETQQGMVQVKSRTTISQTLAVMGEITSIHQHCFSFLEEQRKEKSKLFFRLRQQNNQQRLDKGYWFWGNDEYCLISFWQGDDTFAKIPNIHFKIDIMGRVSLVLMSTDHQNKGQFLHKIADMIGGMQQQKQKGELVAHWEKYYDQYQNEDKRYLHILKDFINREKEIIDAFLLLEKNKEKAVNTLGSLDFISEDVFLKQYEHTLSYKKQFQFDPFSIVHEEIDIKAPKLRLQSMRLENIGHFEDLEIDLSQRIICFLGYNGTGKTTLLRALALGLSGVDDNPEIDTKSKGIQQLLRIGTPNQEGQLSYPFTGVITVRYNLGKDYTNVVVLKKGEGMSSVGLMNDSSVQGDVFGFSAGNNTYKQLFLGFSQLQTATGTDKTTKNDASTVKPNIQDILPLLYDEEDNRFKALGKWIMELDADSKSNTKNEKEVLKFVFSVLSAIMSMEVRLNRIEHQEGLIWLSVNGENTLYDLLSQGFKNVFAWVGHFIKRMYESNDFLADFQNASALILVDEIDTYLHPKWQKNILDVLAEYFPNSSFIVTTHSPLVANYVHVNGEKAVVYIVKKELKKNEVTEESFYEYAVKEHKQAYGRDIRSIFWDWMDVEERPIEVQEKIDSIFELLDTEDKTKIELAEEAIKTLDLPNTEPVMVKLKWSLALAKENIL